MKDEFLSMKIIQTFYILEPKLFMSFELEPIAALWGVKQISIPNSNVCVEASPHQQAILRCQQSVLEFNSIMALSTRR